MTTIEYNLLKHSRQYILSDQGLNVSFNYETADLLNNYVLYYHDNLIYTEVNSQDRKLILLGDIYSYINQDHTNQDILNQLITLTFDEILIATTKMAGRYVIISQDKNNLRVFHDASAFRKIYFSSVKGSTICSSSQHVLAKALEMEPTNDSSKIAYYQSVDFKDNHYSNILDSTFYDEIKQLLPNHCLSVNSGEVIRYWPHETIPELSKAECVKECAGMIKGFLGAVSNRYDVMMPVTAGYDSRVLLAAARDIKHKIYFYLNDIDEVRNSSDITIAQKLLSAFDLELHLVQIPDQVDKEFRLAYSENNLFADQEMITVMFNYLTDFPDKINLPGGTIPVVKSMYHSKVKLIDGAVLAKLHGYDKYKFTTAVYDNWLSNLDGICETTKINLYDLLYWEDRTPIWGGEIQLDKDIAQDEFVVFNSAYLVSRMLSYELSERKQPHYTLHKELIKYLWPELPELPFNPSFKNSIKQLLIKLGIYAPVIKVKKLILK